MTEVKDELLNEFQENDEWDACFNAVDEWDKEHDLIAKSNAVDSEEVPEKEHLQVLRTCFGHTSFRPMQWKIISSIINDRRDNCAIMATGYGKSLCFQFPSVYVGGVTVVISPLISLMEDQVLSLQMMNISACLLGTAQTKQKEVIEEIFEGKYSLVYLTPEFCSGDYGQYLLKRMNDTIGIVLLAIDEAHCVSSWGHDFRFQYRQLGQVRDMLPNTPILAVTATATPKVRGDIVSCLKLRNPQILCSGFDRANLYFSVYLKSSGVIADLKRVMCEKNENLNFPGSTIIYCITRKQTEEIAGQLRSQGIKCLPYHAGMTVKARKEAHEKFVKDKVKVIIATIAFGMGIDKPDVRNIIHYGTSKDIESYYQEVGRAGRDGQPSNCITFYNNADFDLLQKIRELGSGMNEINRNRREAMERIMVQYLETRDCRRQFILNHFEGNVTPKKPKPRCCDNCTRKLQEKVSDCNKYEGLNEQGLYDFTKDAHTFLKVVHTMGGRFGLGMYISFLRGSKTAKISDHLKTHPLNGSGRDKSQDWWKAVGRLLEREQYLKKNANKSRGGHVFSTFSVSNKAGVFLDSMNKGNSNIKIMHQPPPEIFKLLKHKQKLEPSEEASFTSRSLPSHSLPSTSRKSLSSKPSLKLLQIPSKSTSHSDSQSESSDIEKEERMKVYRLLMNKRTELASELDCMPYMVASNAALMKMAEIKPLTIKEFRKCQLEGFTEAKIKRFGEEFVKIIRIICQLEPVTVEDTNKRSIQDILAGNPLPGAKIGATAEASYSIYKSGLTVQEIANKRGVIADTVLSHLIDGIKVGYPIKLIDLNVTDEIRDVIVNIIRNPPINSDMSDSKKIKSLCPSDITIDAVRIVMAYLQVRKHLQKLNVKYEDFESPTDGSTQSHYVSSSEEYKSENVQNKKTRLSMISSVKKRDADSDINDSFTLESSSTNPNPHKKQKLKISHTFTEKESNDSLDFLDSPPGSPHPLNSQKQSPRASTSQKVQNMSLEASLLEDDFFDDVTLLDDVDKAINSSGENSVNKLNVAGTAHKQTISDVKDLINSQTVGSLSSSCGSTEKKFKKFQFKSKVPQSVVESTKQLFSHQSQH